ncbi:MAG: ATP-binding protein [Chitinispirillaceae bacterium]
MKIAIASGKGGTGKTTISTNLSLFVKSLGERVTYLDCDVEEPNGHLFLNPRIEKTAAAFIPVPVIDESGCKACGECVHLCQYNALIRLGKMVMVYPELCHGCGGCMVVCPHEAISEKSREIGFVQTGKADQVGFVHGKLNIGEAMSPPLIRKVLEQVDENGINIIDAPPGTSCPVIASIRDADYVVLVTEPTPFGLNDLELALGMVREVGVPHGVVVNRHEESNEDAYEFCRSHQVSVIGTIPDERRIAEAYSRGDMILYKVPQLRDSFSEIWRTIRKQVEK